MSTCISCQKTATNNEKEIEIYEEAQALANRTGKWVAIYSEGNEYKCVVAEYFTGIPNKGYISPKLPNSAL